MGANSALQDVSLLCDALQAHHGDFTAAVHAYSKEQAPEAKALVRLSRELDRPGTLGWLTFLLPLILDSIFFKLLPSVFTPNVIRMLQNGDYTFQQVAVRKRWDRLGQVTIIGLVLAMAFWLVQSLIHLVFDSAPVLGA